MQLVQRKIFIFFSQTLLTYVQVKVKRFDAVLPQHDDDADLRQIELEEKRGVYEFLNKMDGLMPLIKTFPDDESFSNDYKVDFRV